jgi:hypothetical protein
MTGRRLRPSRTYPERLGGFGNLLTDGLDWIVGQAQSAYSAAGAATDAALADFQAKVAQFQAAFAALKASQSDAQAVGMGSDYDDLVSLFNKVQSMISGAASAYQSTVNFLTPDPNSPNIDYSQVGMYGLGRGHRSMRGLGFAPIIAAAAIAGIVAAIVYALSKYSDYQSKLLSLKQQLIAEGKLSASSLDAPGFIGQSADLLKWGLVGAVFVLLYPTIKAQLARFKRG